MNHLLKDDPEIAQLVKQEEARIENTLNLIAAENHSPPSVMELMGSVLNTKTIEGYPGKRFHAGCEFVDEIESLAIDRAEKLFGAEYANVQPHSGTSANLAVYFSVLDIGDKILSMSLPHGGHLSHGHRASMTSKCFDFEHYTVDPETELINYDLVREQALKFRPKMIVAGASSYPRLIDYQRMSEIAKEVSAYLLADMAHLAGLVAGKVIPSPVPYSDFVTFTCYKTLRGGRGGVILSKSQYAKKLKSAVFPGGQGTSAVNMIAAKGLTFKLAMEPDFVRLQQKTLDLAFFMGQCLKDKGYRLVTGGTDNHQVVMDLGNTQVTGSQAETVLESAGIVLNRNVVPSDADSPKKVSGLRIGTGAIAARNMGDKEAEQIVNYMDYLLKDPENQNKQVEICAKVKEMCSQFPVYKTA